MDFSQLTIVIITKNRSKFLIRNINWWAPTGVKIIIMDGSDTPISSEVINKFLPVIIFAVIDCVASLLNFFNLTRSIY